MTISHGLEINLNTAFEYGMAYVALSRGTSLQTLKLQNFNPKVIRFDNSFIILLIFRANPRAIAFYNNIKYVDVKEYLKSLPEEKDILNVE